MSERIHGFSAVDGDVAVLLPFDLDEIVGAWSDLRRRMVRERIDAFTRDEWAYLASFLDAGSLTRAFRLTFGERGGNPLPVRWLARPRGSVTVWLPNNVSLLGPLSLVLLSLTGNRLFLKEGTRSEGLTSAFVEYVRLHGSAALQALLAERVQVLRAEREDPRVVAHTRASDVVIAFGSDDAMEAAAAQVRSGATLIPFRDRRSEAWIVPSSSDEVLLDLIKVFAVYGQAGCTSPSRVVVIDGTEAGLSQIRERIVRLWPDRLRNTEPHVASANILGGQLAAAHGWDATLVVANSAVVATGSNGMTVPQSGLVLPIVALPLQEAIAALPENIQTIGHDLDSADALQWLAGTPVKRIVPIAAMHHFGSVWDGRKYWSECFEWVEVGA